MTCTIVLLVSVCIPSISFAILQKGEAAPPIKVVSTSGQPITLANYRGQVLLIDFFASWCSPCRDAVPHLNELRGKYGKQGFHVLGLSVDDEGEKVVREFAADRKVAYPVALAAEELQTEYGLRSVPVMFLINKKGIVAEKYQGFSEDTRKAVEKAIKRLLAE